MVVQVVGCRVTAASESSLEGDCKDNRVIVVLTATASDFFSATLLGKKTTPLARRGRLYVEWLCAEPRRGLSGIY